MKGGLSIPWPCLVKLKPRLRPPTSAAARDSALRSAAEWTA